MKRKKSAGIDGISQEILVQGAPSLTTTLTDIFNTSITNRRVSSDGSAVDFGLKDPEFEPRWFQ